jgi:hypothetical protein
MVTEYVEVAQRFAEQVERAAGTSARAVRCHAGSLHPLTRTECRIIVPRERRYVDDGSPSSRGGGAHVGRH